MTIVLQIQYNHQYSATPISIENSYNTAYNNYVAQNNSIANSYTNAINSYNQASTTISQANQKVDNSYATAMSISTTILLKQQNKKNIMNFHNVLQVNYFLLLFTYSNRQPHNLDFGLVNGFPSDNRLNKLACVFNFRRASATDS